MRIRILSAADLQSVLPVLEAIEAMKEAYAELSSGQALVPQRLAIPIDRSSGTTLVKPALTTDGLGAKLVSVFPQNRQMGKVVTPGIVVSLDPETGYPIGVCDGTYLTALRTGAAVGAATDLLARSDVKEAAVIGCGGQARTLILAMDTVRHLESLRVFDRHTALAEKVAEELQPQVRARLQVAASADEAIAGATLVSTVTTSPEPVFDGRGLMEGCHLNGVGSFTPQMREIDVEAVRRSRVFVDSHSAAQMEAGDLLAAEQAGATDRAEWTEIGDVVRSARPGRTSLEEITLFKTVGLAVQDVKAAAWALERAAAAGVGTLVEL